MNPFGKNNSTILIYVPSIIVLVFSMLALHFTVSLIHSRTVFEGKHGEYVQALSMFHKDYYSFSQKFKDNVQKENEFQISKLKNDFSLINEKYAQLHKMNLSKGRKTEDHISDRDHILYLIARGLQEIADHMNLYEQKKGTPQEQDVKENLNAHIAETLHVIMLLQTSMLKEYQNVLDTDKISQSENWLYWSVIIMGLSGFVLVLINGQKIHDLRVAEQERHRQVLEGVGRGEVGRLHPLEPVEEPIVHDSDRQTHGATAGRLLDTHDVLRNGGPIELEFLGHPRDPRGVEVCELQFEDRLIHRNGDPIADLVAEFGVDRHCALELIVEGDPHRVSAPGDVGLAHVLHAHDRLGAMEFTETEEMCEVFTLRDIQGVALQQVDRLSALDRFTELVDDPVHALLHLEEGAVGGRVRIGPDPQLEAVLQTVGRGLIEGKARAV